MTTAIGPAPDGGGLELSIECTASPSARFGAVHTVTIHPDWNVTTPHDLEAERVAVVFGGWSSCLDFADGVASAYRRLLGVMAREVPLERDAGGRWLTSEAPGCCPQPRGFDSLDGAVVHEASVPHLAKAFGTTHWQVEQIRSAARSIWSKMSDPALVVGGADGYQALWDRGIHPARVQRIAERMPASARPLTVKLYASVEYRDIDIDWLADVVAVYPTPEFADWCVWHAAVRDLIPPAEVAALRGLGLAARDAMIALEGGLDAETISSIAGAAEASAPTIARWRGAWAAVGCAPSGEHYRLLADHRALHVRPQPTEVDDVCAAVAGSVDRTEVAVMLAIEPHRERVIAALRRGVRSAADPRLLT